MITNKKAKWIFWGTVLFVGVIFANSLFPSDLSDFGSLSIVDFIQGIIDSMSMDFTVTNRIVRKSAHFIEYAILGVLLALTAAASGGDRRRAFALAVAAAIIIPIIDENIQRFVPGRTFFFSDIALDIAGVAAGFLFVIARKGIFFKKCES